MGVWIETGNVMMTGDEEKVTPYVGVWIETAIEARVIAWVASLLMWECGLKHTRLAVVRKDAASLLMWGCGLKHYVDGVIYKAAKSLLMWECGLKL